MCAVVAESFLRSGRLRCLLPGEENTDMDRMCGPPPRADKHPVHSNIRNPQCNLGGLLGESI